MLGRAPRGPLAPGRGDLYALHDLLLVGWAAPFVKPHSEAQKFAGVRADTGQVQVAGSGLERRGFVLCPKSII